MRSGIGTVLFYGVPILAILLVLPPAQEQRLQYELSQLIPLAVMVLLGLLFYAIGRRTRQ